MFHHQDDDITFFSTPSIHGTGKFTYIDPIKMNYSCIGKYTLRPMDPSWDRESQDKPSFATIFILVGWLVGWLVDPKHISEKKRKKQID